MKTITWQVCTLLLVSLGLLAGCKPQQDVTTLRLAHTLDQQHVVHKAMVLMAERLEHYSNGSMQIDIYSGGQLGNERELIELLQIGSLAMTKVSASSVESFVPQMRVFSVPYIFNDNAHLWQVLNGATGQQLLQGLSTARLYGLGYYDEGCPYWVELATDDKLERKPFKDYITLYFDEEKLLYELEYHWNPQYTAEQLATFEQQEKERIERIKKAANKK